MSTELRNALLNLAEQANEDCPSEYRSRHFFAALHEAFELLNAPEPTLPSDSKCPVCGSEDVSFDNLNVDDGHVYQDGDCIECDASWSNVYNFSGINRNSN
jgi:hypothetical protein